MYRLAISLSVAAACWASLVAAQEKFQKLTGAQIRGKIAGMEMSDEVHWRDFYDRNGKVTSRSMGRKRTGIWRIKNDELCVEFENEMLACYQVLMSGKKAKLQREGSVPLEVVIEPPGGRM
jgi:hypothetical protein